MAEKINIFFLPFAGGSRYAYRQYEQKMPDPFNLISLEYPGRGSRIKDPFASDVQCLADDLYCQVRNELDNGVYAIYGHSMGGLMAYLLSRKIVENKHRPPLHLFITGTSGPSSPSRTERNYHLLDKKSFLQKIIELKGLPDEIINDEALLDFFEPILRADFKITETYLYEKNEPLDIPITVITGAEEDLYPSEILLWQNETRYKVDFRKMRGNHFFIFQHIDLIIQIIAARLLPLRYIQQPLMKRG